MKRDDRLCERFGCVGRTDRTSVNAKHNVDVCYWLCSTMQDKGECCADWCEECQAHTRVYQSCPFTAEHAVTQ